MSIVRAGEVELDVERSGSGPPLLQIMGMSGTALHWGDELLEALRADFEVIAYDHRSVGASSRLTDGQVAIPQLAEDAAALIGALGFESVHVMSISMGGMVAQELALEHPSLVRTLTLGCTYCGGEGSALAGPEVIGKLSEAMMSGDRERAVRAGWEVNVSPAFAADDEAWERFAALSSRRAVAVPVVMAQMQAVMAHDTRTRLPELQMPVQVVHGTADQMLPVQNGHLIASLIPGARLEILEETGHLYFWEQPQRSAELVRELAAVPA